MSKLSDVSADDLEFGMSDETATPTPELLSIMEENSRALEEITSKARG